MRKFTRKHIHMFLEKYATDARVLDIGAGGDEHKDLFPNRVTLDVNRDRRPDVVGDAEHLPFADGSFDGIVCSEVLEHIYDPKRAIIEMQRVLKSGGMLVLTARFVFPVHDAPGDFWRFTPYGLRELFAGWDIVEVRAETDVFSTVAVLLQRIVFQTELRGGRASKALIYAIALFLKQCDPLINKRFGDIQRTREVECLLSSGVYIAAKKK